MDRLGIPQLGSGRGVLKPVECVSLSRFPPEPSFSRQVRMNLSHCLVWSEPCLGLHPGAQHKEQVDNVEREVLLPVTGTQQRC